PMCASAQHRALGAFPTRRSSDLDVRDDKRRWHQKSLPLPIFRPFAPPSVLSVLRSGCSATAEDGPDRAEGGNVGHWSIIIIKPRSEEHTSELQSRENLVCRLLLE